MSIYEALKNANIELKDLSLEDRARALGMDYHCMMCGKIYDHKLDIWWDNHWQYKLLHPDSIPSSITGHTEECEETFRRFLKGAYK